VECELQEDFVKQLHEPVRLRHRPDGMCFLQRVTLNPSRLQLCLSCEESHGREYMHKSGRIYKVFVISTPEAFHCIFSFSLIFA